MHAFVHTQTIRRFGDSQMLKQPGGIGDGLANKSDHASAYCAELSAREVQVTHYLACDPGRGTLAFWLAIT